MPDIKDTLAERGARYGKFEDHARIAQNLQDAMRAAAGWQKLAADQKQALSVIADKIARILNGDPDYSDNWHDIIGYAKLVEDRLSPESAPALPNQTDIVQLPTGFTPWFGGRENPVGDRKVEYVLREDVRKIHKEKAHLLHWPHHGIDPRAHIIGYRVPSPLEG